MKYSAKTIVIFGVYLLGLGGTLVFAPNQFLKAFGLPTTEEVWIRVVGMLVTLLSFYYLEAARRNLTEFIQLTVYARMSVMFFFIGFVLKGIGSPTLILFGLVDFIAAVWTQYALNQDRLLKE